MSMNLKPGTRLFSAVCTTEMITVKAPAGAVDVTIGGVVPVTSAADRDGAGAIVDGHGGGAQIGKRYVDDAGAIELLCTKAGDGSLSVGDVVLPQKDAKPLPASD